MPGRATCQPTMTEPRFDEVQCLSPTGLHTMRWTEWGEPDNPRVLLCVHGLTRVGRDFDRLARELAPHYRVVCPDVVGRGRSDWLRDPMASGDGPIGWIVGTRGNSEF